MTCFAIDRAFQHPDVNIGWFPFRATRLTDIRTIPGAGRIAPGPKSPSGCGHDIRDLPRDERIRVVKAQDVYLRYSPAGPPSITSTTPTRSC
jgi:hypothetical protein